LVGALEDALCGTGFFPITISPPRDRMSLATSVLFHCKLSQRDNGAVHSPGRISIIVWGEKLYGMNIINIKRNEELDDRIRRRKDRTSFPVLRQLKAGRTDGFNFT